MTTPPRLTVPQSRALLAVLSEPNYEAAAAKAGCSSRQLRRWRRLPQFQQVLAEVRTDALHMLANRLALISSRAVQVLEQELERPGSPNTRLRAAEVVLSNLLRLVELTDVAERIERLEKGTAPDACIEIEA